MKIKFQKPRDYHHMSMAEKAAWLKNHCDHLVFAYSKGLINLRGKRHSSKKIVAREISKYLQHYLNNPADNRFTERDIELAIDVLSHQFLTNVEFQNKAREALREIVSVRDSGVSHEFYCVINQAINKASAAWKASFPNAKYAERTPSEALQHNIQKVSGYGISFSLISLVFNTNMDYVGLFAASILLYGINGELSDNIAYLMHANEAHVAEEMNLQQKASHLLNRCHEKTTAYTRTRLNLFGYRQSIHLELLKAITVYLEAYLKGDLRSCLSKQITQYRNQVGMPHMTPVQIEAMVDNSLNERDIDFAHELINQQYEFPNAGLITWIHHNQPEYNNETQLSDGFNTYFTIAVQKELAQWKLRHPKSFDLYSGSLALQVEFKFLTMLTASIAFNLFEINPTSIAVLFVVAGLNYFSGELVDNWSHLTSFAESSATSPLSRRV